MGVVIVFPESRKEGGGCASFRDHRRRVIKEELIKLSQAEVECQAQGWYRSHQKMRWAAVRGPGAFHSLSTWAHFQISRCWGADFRRTVGRQDTEFFLAWDRRWEPHRTSIDATTTTYQTTNATIASSAVLRFTTRSETTLMKIEQIPKYKNPIGSFGNFW